MKLSMWPALVMWPALAVGALPLLSGCLLLPAGFSAEQERLQTAGRAYERPFSERSLPELSPTPNWEEVLRRALLANGELEEAYFAWAAAMHRVEQAASYPNTPLSVNVSYMLSGGMAEALDRVTVLAGPDPMENLLLPPKVTKAAAASFAEAKAAWARFVERTFLLQQQVLGAWIDYALTAEQLRIEEEDLALHALSNETALGRISFGELQGELLRAETERLLAENRTKERAALLSRQRALLNAMLARPVDAPLPPPKEIPTRALGSVDAAALAERVRKANPRLLELSFLAEGRERAVERAKLDFLPDLNPSFGFTGSVAQSVGVGVSIPTFLPSVRARLAEAEAALRQSRALLRQRTFDTAAAAHGALIALEDGSRQAAMFERQILPAARRLAEQSRAEYSAARGSLRQMIESRRMLLEVRLLGAQAEALREQSLIALEALAASTAGPGFDSTSADSPISDSPVSDSPISDSPVSEPAARTEEDLTR